MRCQGGIGWKVRVEDQLSGFWPRVGKVNCAVGKRSVFFIHCQQICCMWEEKQKIYFVDLLAQLMKTQKLLNFGICFQSSVLLSQKMNREGLQGGAHQGTEITPWVGLECHLHSPSEEWSKHCIRDTLSIHFAPMPSAMAHWAVEKSGSPPGHHTLHHKPTLPFRPHISKQKAKQICRRKLFGFWK